jgi:hypothetical protein
MLLKMVNVEEYDENDRDLLNLEKDVVELDLEME